MVGGLCVALYVAWCTVGCVLFGVVCVCDVCCVFYAGRVVWCVVMRCGVCFMCCGVCAMCCVVCVVAPVLGGVCCGVCVMCCGVCTICCGLCVM